MKKPCGSNFEYERDRNNDLMRAYREQLDIMYHAEEPICLPTLYRRVAEMPSKRFWVSEKRAAIVVSKMQRGDNLKTMRQMSREMFGEIYRRFVQLKKKCPHLKDDDIITIVCNQPAPKFYLTPQSVKVIICKIKRGWYEERKRKLHFMA